VASRRTEASRWASPRIEVLDEINEDFADQERVRISNHAASRVSRDRRSSHANAVVEELAMSIAWYAFIDWRSSH
jgi:hypothetical protein